MLEVDGLTKQFGKSVVVDQISFSVDAGEVVGLVGPNGAGKSTSMKMICALLRPNSGSVRIDGVPLSGSTRRSYLSRLGALIESPAFYPGLSGRNHLAYLTRMRGEFSDSLVTDTLAHVGLDATSAKPVSKYSTGMKQRLGIAMAILHKPKVLVLDEPTNGLDPAAIVGMRKLISQLAENGTAVLVSSHLLSEIERVCNRVVFIKAGRVARSDVVQLNAPTFAAMLLRSSNPEGAREVLVKEDFVLNVEANEDGLICTVTPQSVHRIATVLVRSGLDILELSPAKSNLEQTYVSEYGSGMEERLE